MNRIPNLRVSPFQKENNVISVSIEPLLMSNQYPEAYENPR